MHWPMHHDGLAQLLTHPASQSITACAAYIAQGKIVGELMKKHLVETVVPVMCELRHMLQVSAHRDGACGEVVHVLAVISSRCRCEYPCMPGSWGSVQACGTVV